MNLAIDSIEQEIFAHSAAVAGERGAYGYYFVVDGDKVLINSAVQLFDNHIATQICEAIAEGKQLVFAKYVEGHGLTEETK